MNQNAINYRSSENDDNSSRAIGGLGIVFYDGTPQTQFRVFSDLIERISPDAISDDLLKNCDCRALFNHNSSNILGRNTAGTLQLTRTNAGIEYEIDLPNTELGNTVLEAIKRGDISGSSFAFMPTKTEWSREVIDGKECDVVTITEITRLSDIGPVTYPAYEGTTSNNRSKDSEIYAEYQTRCETEKTALLKRQQMRADGQLIINKIAIKK